MNIGASLTYRAEHDCYTYRDFDPPKRGQGHLELLILILGLFVALSGGLLFPLLDTLLALLFLSWHPSVR